MTKSLATCWNAGALHQRHCARVDVRVRWSRRQCYQGVKRIRASGSCCGIIPTGRVVSVLWGEEGPAGSRRSSVRPEARLGGGAGRRRLKGEKWRERVAGKAAGDECVFIPGERPGWQMRSGCDAMPDAAGGDTAGYLDL